MTPVSLPPAPQGYRTLPFSGFSALVGPLFWRIGPKGFELGFRVTPDQCNGMLSVHGGMIATLMDMQLAIGARVNDERVRDNYLPTISLQLDYLSGATSGAWVYGQTEVLKVTRRMVFVQGLALTEGEVIARASAVLKIGESAKGTAVDVGEWLRTR